MRLSISRWGISPPKKWFNREVKPGIFLRIILASIFRVFRGNRLTTISGDHPLSFDDLQVGHHPIRSSRGSGVTKYCSRIPNFVVLWKVASRSRGNWLLSPGHVMRGIADHVTRPPLSTLSLASIQTRPSHVWHVRTCCRVVEI
jgi:hypothetical protein